MKEQQLFSAVLVKEHSKMFDELAADRHKTKSALLREWIEEKHEKLKRGKK